MEAAVRIAAVFMLKKWGKDEAKKEQAEKAVEKAHEANKIDKNTPSLKLF